MNDIENFLKEYPNFYSAVVMGLSDILEHYPDKNETATFALAVIEEVIKQEQEVLSNPTDITTVNEYRHTN